MSNKSCLQTGCLVGLLIIAGAAWWTFKALPRLRMENRTEYAVTPTQIQSIRDVGQWEFLSINDEEIVDTVREGFFTDDYLVRIYYGTLRLGIDMSRLSDSAFIFRGDTLVLSLPEVGLLDSSFIDEARTRVFHESGRWTAADRERLYEKARRQMLAHSLSTQNKTIARDNADAQVRQMLRAMGFKNVEIAFYPK